MTAQCDGPVCAQTWELRGGTALAWGPQEGCLEEVYCSEIGRGAQKGLVIHFLQGNSYFWLSCPKWGLLFHRFG